MRPMPTARRPRPIRAQTIAQAPEPTSWRSILAAWCARARCAAPCRYCTVPVADPFLLAFLAVIVTEPAFVPVTTPLFETHATDLDDDDHVHCCVTSTVLPSLNVPVAVSCCLPPRSTVNGFGVTAMDCSVGAVTVRAALAEAPPYEAVIVVEPLAIAVASPGVPPDVEDDTTATPVLELVQVASADTSCVVPSLYVPVAVNLSWYPAGTLALAGEIATPTMAAGLTVTSHVAEKPSNVAVTV